MQSGPIAHRSRPWRGLFDLFYEEMKRIFGSITRAIILPGPAEKYTGFPGPSGLWHHHRFHSSVVAWQMESAPIQSPNAHQKSSEIRYSITQYPSKNDPKSMEKYARFHLVFVRFCHQSTPGGRLRPIRSPRMCICAHTWHRFIPDATRKGFAKINGSLENSHHPHWKIATTPIGYLPPPPLDIYHHPH